MLAMSSPPKYTGQHTQEHERWRPIRGGRICVHSTPTLVFSLVGYIAELIWRESSGWSADQASLRRLVVNDWRPQHDPLVITLVVSHELG